MNAITTVRPSTGSGKTTPSTPAVRFGFRNLEMTIAENQVWNRLLIDMIGYHGPSTALARNKFERIEIAWDWLCWFTLAAGMPILMGKLFNGSYTHRKLKPLGIRHAMPLAVPFESVDAAALKKSGSIAALQKLLGTTTAEATGKAARLIRRGKMAIVVVDLIFLALKGQAGHWGKNLITARLSGKTGFSGEFGYTDEAFRQKKAARHEENKLRKWLISLAWAGVGVVTLPIAMAGFLRNPSETKAKNTFGKAMQWGIKNLNYHNAIYMSKYLMIWHSVFNFVAPSLLAARDREELRERAIKAAATEFFFFIGDDVISGIAARVLQWRHKAKLQGFQIAERGWFGLPKAVEYTHLAAHPTAHTGYQQALRLSRQAFWLGILGTGLSLGVILNLVNNWYTKRKVMAEQQAGRGVNAIGLAQKQPPRVNTAKLIPAQAG